MYLIDNEPPLRHNAIRLVVCAHGKADVSVAKNVAAAIGVPFQQDDQCDEAAWQLRVEGNQRIVTRTDGTELRIDFTSGKATRHAQEQNLINQPIAKAVGISAFEKKHKRLPSVVDATAGLGQDAWLLASLGCTVTMIEQSPLLAHLLECALQTAALDEACSAISQRMSVIQANAVNWLDDDGTINPDVVYLDPMYPIRRKSAKVKKGMQFLHELVGPQQAESELLHAALRRATHRVAVKRPATAAPLEGTHAFKGQITSVASPNTRYDVYHCH